MKRRFVEGVVERDRHATVVVGSRPHTLVRSLESLSVP